jgi:hypothetical protein
MNAKPAPRVQQIFTGMRKTGVDWRRIFFSHFLLREIVMTSSHMNAWISPIALAIIACAASADVALASQGPGGGMGTANHLTQMAMAILVYGISAVVVGAGLIGAVRGR